MVFEFPELQGVMGRYYALHDAEPQAVAEAIREHYLPRFAGDDLPATASGQALALADRLDSLIGIFAIGQQPSGEVDPSTRSPDLATTTDHIRRDYFDNLLRNPEQKRAVWEDMKLLMKAMDLPLPEPQGDKS